MTVTGSGVGDNLGGPHIPLQRDLEATAWTEVNKLALGISMDTLDKVMTEISPRYVFGYLGGFGYKSSPGQPLLDHPLESVRAEQSSTPSANSNWKEAYEKLVKILPENVQRSLIAQQKLPLDQRSSAFIALDNTLTLMAKFTENLQYAAEPAPPESIQAELNLLHFIFPLSTLKGALAHAEEVSKAGNTYLQAIGPNSPHFDGLLDALNQLQTALNTVHGLNDTLFISPEGELSPTAHALATLAQTQLSSLASQIGAVSLGNDLQLLKPTVEALNSVVSSLTLPSTGSAPLYLSLAMATMGSGQHGNMPPLIGADLQTLANALSSGIASSALADATPAGKTLFNNLMSTALLTLIGVAGHLAAESDGPYPPMQASDLDAAKTFSSDLRLTAIAASGLIESFFREALAISGGNVQAQQLGGSSLSAFSILLLSLADQKTGNTPSATSIADQRKHLEEGIISAQQLMELSEGSKTAAGSTADVALSQMQRALEEKNEQDFIQTSGSLLAQAGISDKGLKNDLSTIQKTVRTLVQSSREDRSDQQLTGIVHIV